MLNWIEVHPWMTFVLGIMSLLTLNTFFVSIGGGYKKFPSTTSSTKDDHENVDILKD